MENTLDTTISPSSSGINAPAQYDILLLTYRINKALNAPASQPARAFVRRNLIRCMDTLFVSEPVVAVEWLDLKINLIKLIHAGAAEDSLQLYAVGGIATKHPAWSLLALMPADASQSTAMLIAAEFLLAVRLDRQMRPGPLELARVACMQTLDKDAFLRHEQKIKNYANRLVGDLRSYCSIEKRGLKSAELLFEARLTACLVARSRSLQHEDREGSGLARLTSIELQATIQSLHSGCLHHELKPAIQLAAFRVGLPWPLFLNIPFATARKPEVMVQFDVQAMEFLIDLAQVFHDRDKQEGQSFVPTSSVHRLRIPKEAGVVIQQAYYNNPNAERLSDLMDGSTEETAIPGIHEGAIRVTVARLIATAGASAVSAGVDSAVAAYLTLQFGLIGHSAHAYFNATSKEMLVAEQKWFTSLGLSHPVSVCPDHHVAVGASSTPTQEAIQSLYTWRVEQVHLAAPGRRCGLPRLLHFHDCFTRAVTLMVALCLGSRNESPMTIQADDPTSHLSTINYQHKLNGPSMGLSVLPCPELLKCQIELWFCHLERLMRRMEHIDPHNQLIGHIQRVLDRQSVPLLFLASDGYKPASSADIFSDLTDAKLRLSLDFSRHFFMNDPRRFGVTHEETEAWLRHHSRSRSSYLMTSMGIDSDWMSTMSAAIDATLGDMKIRPIVGLGRKK
ncbi:hypothetical protein [Polaromonas sp. YR568]|uniref:hypothetical protein n=1 Tax=Polaromonas sp. YR568 TaxID=1855301 RepID=UPI0031380B86